MTMYHRVPYHALAALLIALLLGGCASQVPLLIRQGPVDSPTPAVVREHFGDYTGRAVRWGGVLIATDNREQVTRLTILARPLANDGEPGTGDSNLGRFIAIVPGFLDPEVYAPDRLVTVTGTLRGSELGMIGNHPYVYPVVEAQAWHLWPEPEVPYGAPYPWWYDPWYGPWWYGSWYDPWYYPSHYPRWHPHHHPHKRKPDRPGTTPAPDARPIMPAPRHPRPVPRVPRERPEAGTAPPPGHHAAPPREQRPDGRQPPEPQVRPESGTAPPPGHHAAPPHEHRPAERQRHEPRETREQPQADAAPQRERNVERQRERMERSMERSQPKPAQVDRPDTGRGFRGFFRRWRGD